MHSWPAFWKLLDEAISNLISVQDVVVLLFVVYLHNAGNRKWPVVLKAGRKWRFTCLWASWCRSFCAERHFFFLKSNKFSSPFRDFLKFECAVSGQSSSPRLLITLFCFSCSINVVSPEITQRWRGNDIPLFLYHGRTRRRLMEMAGRKKGGRSVVCNSRRGDSKGIRGEQDGWLEVGWARWQTGEQNRTDYAQLMTKWQESCATSSYYFSIVSNFSSLKKGNENL